MNIARLLYPVKVLGPGNRVGIWVCGCHRGCKGCSNPELWFRKPEFEIEVSPLLKMIESVNENQPIDGFTISGGEPMEQAVELAILVDKLRPISEDILIYTGYQIEDLWNRDQATQHVLENAAILIDGEYVEDENNDCLLRGSSNQRIHILNSKFEKLYKEYFSKAHNQIQNFTTTDGIVSVGIHRKGFTV